MANEIYSSSWWGEGVCTNTIDWGSSYKALANCTPTPPVFNNTYSLAFDGVDDYVDCGNISALNGVTTATWSGWFNRGVTGTCWFMSTYGTTSSTIQFGAYSSASTITVLMGNSVGTQKTMFNNSSLTLTTGTWYHLAFVYNEAEFSNANKMKVYVDGVLQVNSVVGSALTTLNSSTANFEIGKLGGYTTNEFNGKIDEVAIFTSALTSENISTIYNSGVPNDLTSLNPVAWYRNGDNGTWKSPQWLIPNNENKTKFSNYSFSYDGVNDYINCGNDSSLKPTSAYSISGWFKIDTLATIKTIISNDRNNGFMVWINASNELDFYHWDGSWKILTSTSTFLIDTWYHFSVTWDLSTTTGKLYINGVYNNQNTNFNQIIYLSDPLYIGTYNPSFYFNGNIDDIAVFNKVLTPTEITEIYNSSVPTDISSLSPVGYWRSEQSIFTDNWLVDNSALSNYSTRSFAFDGISDYIETTKTTALTTASLSMWVKVTGNFAVNERQSLASNDDFNHGRDFIIADSPTTTNDAYIGMFAGGIIYGKTSASGGIPINDGNWHHLVWTYDGSAGSSASINMYVDGQNQYSNATYSSFWSYEIKFQYFGKPTSANTYFSGSMDEVAYFNSILSASDITSIYNSGVPARIEGAVSHWRMGEDATFNTNWNVPDQVGSATGTSANMTISDLEGEAPNYTGGGLSNNMTIEDRVGDASNSSNNALSYNMDEVDRETDVPT